MESDPIPWLAYRTITDLVVWAIVLSLLLLYLWALTMGPVSAIDPAPRAAPIPVEKQVPTRDGGPPLA